MAKQEINNKCSSEQGFKLILGYYKQYFPMCTFRCVISFSSPLSLFVSLCLALSLSLSLCLFLFLPHVLSSPLPVSSLSHLIRVLHQFRAPHTHLCLRLRRRYVNSYLETYYTKRSMLKKTHSLANQCSVWFHFDAHVCINHHSYLLRLIMIKRVWTFAHTF